MRGEGKDGTRSFEVIEKGLEKRGVVRRGTLAKVATQRKKRKGA